MHQLVLPQKHIDDPHRSSLDYLINIEIFYRHVNFLNEYGLSYSLTELIPLVPMVAVDGIDSPQWLEEALEVFTGVQGEDIDDSYWVLETLITDMTSFMSDLIHVLSLSGIFDNGIPDAMFLKSINENLRYGVVTVVLR